MFPQNSHEVTKTFVLRPTAKAPPAEAEPFWKASPVSDTAPDTLMRLTRLLMRTPSKVHAAGTGDDPTKPAQKMDTLPAGDGATTKGDVKATTAVPAGQSERRSARVVYADRTLCSADTGDSPTKAPSTVTDAAPGVQEEA